MKSNLIHIATMAALVSLAAPAFSADVPRPSSNDPRIRVAVYNPMEVTVIRVKRGAVTRIFLAPGEKIEMAPTGISSRCEKDEDDWCIHAAKGSNQIFVRPKENATSNNIELSTDKNNYSLEFKVVDDKAGGVNDAFYRVVFEYPKPAGAANAALVAGLLSAIEPRQAGQAEEALPPAVSPQDRLKAEGPIPKNSQYTMQVLENGEDAAPSLVFDDGRFTYFEFAGSREIPAIFAYGSDGEPTRVNWHFKAPFVVVERMARKFTLRLGKAVVGIFNEGFDPVGIDTPTKTISGGVVRVVKTEAAQ